MNIIGPVGHQKQALTIKRIANVIGHITDGYSYITTRRNGKVRTRRNQKQFHRKIAALLEGGAQLSLYSSGETCWFCIHIEDRMTVRKVIQYLLERGFESPIRINTGDCVALLYRVPFVPIHDRCDLLVRRLHKKWPAVKLQHETRVDDRWVGKSWTDHRKVTNWLKIEEVLFCPRDIAINKVGAFINVS